MKMLVLFLAFNTVLFAQDSTNLEFTYIEDDHLRLSNRMNDIEMLTLTCKDTSMRGKKFKFVLKEYVKGELANTEYRIEDCKEVTREFQVDSIIYVHKSNPCERFTFKDNMKEYKIIFAIKKNDDSASLVVRHDYAIDPYDLKSGLMYNLRKSPLDKTGKYNFPLGKLTPILAYTPPFDTGTGMHWLCILDTEDPGIWYEKYNIEHFYVFSLLIE